MNLLFDINATQPNSTGKRHGGGKYGEVVLKRMLERGVPILCFYDSNKWLNPEIEELCRKTNTSLIDIQHQSISSIVQTEHIDVLYSPLPEQLPTNIPCKVIGTIHGLRLIERPFDFYLIWNYVLNPFNLLKVIKNEISNRNRQMVWKQVNIMLQRKNFEFVTVSNHSKYSLLSQFPQLSCTDVPVFYSPPTSVNQPVQKSPSKEKYFLMVSANRWDKNNLRGVIALDRLFSQGHLKDYKVILTGCVFRKRSKIKSMIVPSGDLGKYVIVNKDHFILKEYITDNELESLYANAFALLYPSLNEGFGYPPIEAMKYGVPVLASAISSIPEVCGDAAMYFAPFSIEEIMNRIIQLTDENTHQEYCHRAQQQYVRINKRQKEDLDKLIDYIIEAR